MGPYAQIELPVSVYTAWDALFGEAGTKYWILNMHGKIENGAKFPILMGDASGIVEMSVDEVIQPGRKPPSFLPYVEYRLRRPSWGSEIPGRIWLEPSGWGKCLLQVFHYNWESLPGGLQLSEREIITGYWSGAVRRAQQFVWQSMMGPQKPTNTAPHNW
jgi:hypothetical protein